MSTFKPTFMASEFILISNTSLGTSLVVQWLAVLLPMRWTQV